jgi:phosphoribosylformylglycinamidine cyclo-ligase
MSSASYARSGVDTDEAQRALSRLILELGPTQAYGPQCDVGVGHFAAVIRVGPLRLALTTDGVGTKLLVAQALDKYDGVGIDCVGMNVNDLLCVGATPLTMLDYIACEVADPEVFSQIGKSLAEGARQAGISIVGGETAQIRDMLRGVSAGKGLDLVGMALGIVPEGALLDGSRIEPGDVAIGIASTGLHSNGYSLARSVLLGQYKLDATIRELGCTLGEEMLRPVRIYVPHVRALREAGVELHAMAHITGDGLLNMRRVEAPVGFVLADLPEPPPIFSLIERTGALSRAEMRVVFNMGIGLVVTVPERDADKALAALGKTDAAAWRIGHAVADPERRIRIPAEHIIGHSQVFVRDA